MHSIKIDWYRASFPFERKDDALALVEKLGEKFKDEGKGRWGYETKIMGPSKSSINFSRGILGGRPRPECCADLNGTFVGSLDVSGQSQIVGNFGLYGAAESRVDVAFDDYDRSVLPRQVDEAYDSGCVVGFNDLGYNGSKKNRRKTAVHVDDFGVHFGKQGSAGCGKYLIVYDKNIQSKGEVNAIRWEMRFFNKRAVEVGGYLRQSVSGEDFTNRLGGLIAGNVNFKNVEVNKDKSKAPRLPWWEDICKKLGDAKRISVPKVDHTLEDKRNYFARTQTRTLALLRAWYDKHHPGYGFDSWLGELLNRAETNFTDAERALVDAAAAPDFDLPF